MARDYEYIDSVACYGEIGNNVFDRLAESRREVWFGDDGSGLIRSQHIRSRFFTREQQLRWESMPTRAAREATGPSLDLFAAGCFHGPRRELARLPSGRAELEGYLRSRRQLTLNAIHQLIGEALVPSRQRQVLFDLAAGLPGAWIRDGAADQLGRVGVGVGRVERDLCEELVLTTTPGSFSATNKCWSILTLSTRRPLVPSRDGPLMSAGNSEPLYQKASPRCPDRHAIHRAAAGEQ